MKFAPIIPLSSSAVTEHLKAALASASPGAAFSVPLDDARHALLTLAAVRENAASAEGVTPNSSAGVSHRPRVYDSELFPIITHRLITGQARSSLAATKQIVAEGLYPANGGTPENRAHRLSKLYRAACIPASAFQNPKYRTQIQLQPKQNLPQ